MLCLGGLLALDITTTTPDALCPPLAEVRAAVEQRVGEVRSDYRAQFALIRGASGPALELVLLEGEREVLRRELTLEGADCQDAAQTIALVLERYFDAVERPPTPELESEPEPVSSRRTDSAAAIPDVTKATPAPTTNTVTERNALSAHAGLAYDWELGLAPLVGTSLFPKSWVVTRSFAIGAAFDLGAFVNPKSETIRGEEISVMTLRAALYVPLALRLGAWSGWLGPWGQLSLQRARAESLSRAHEAYRTLPGAGGFWRLGWMLSSGWTLAATAAAGAQLTSTSSRLVLERSDGTRNAVLVPASWFGQAQLTLGMTLE